MNHPEKKISEDALWTLSNVTAGNHAQVQAIIDAGLIPLVIHHLDRGEFEAQKQAAFAIHNMTSSGNKEQVAYFVNCGVIPPFCNLLSCKDSEVIQAVLNGIRNIFLKMSVNQDGEDKVRTLIEECGGLDKIASLKNHEGVEISKMARDIIKNYFSSDVEEDANLSPEAAETALQFDPNAAMMPSE